MIAALATNTARECLRRAFPYVAIVSVVLLALGSKLFLAFSFGAADTETVNVGISAVFLAGFLAGKCEVLLGPGQTGPLVKR